MRNTIEEEYKQVEHVIKAKQHELKLVQGRVKQPVHIKGPLIKVIEKLKK